MVGHLGDQIASHANQRYLLYRSDIPASHDGEEGINADVFVENAPAAANVWLLRISVLRTMVESPLIMNEGTRGTLMMPPDDGATTIPPVCDMLRTAPWRDDIVLLLRLKRPRLRCR